MRVIIIIYIQYIEINMKQSLYYYISSQQCSFNTTNLKQYLIIKTATTKKRFGLLGQYNRVATVSTLYLTVSGITITGFKSIGQI